MRTLRAGAGFERRAGAAVLSLSGSSTLQRRAGVPRPRVCELHARHRYRLAGCAWDQRAIRVGQRMKIMRESVANTASFCARRALVSNGRNGARAPWRHVAAGGARREQRQRRARSADAPVPRQRRRLSAGCVRGATSRSPWQTGSSRAAAVALQRAALETGVIPGGNLRGGAFTSGVSAASAAAAARKPPPGRRFHERRRDRAWCVFRHTARWHASVHASVAAAISAGRDALKQTTGQESQPSERTGVPGAPACTGGARSDAQRKASCTHLRRRTLLRRCWAWAPARATRGAVARSEPCAPRAAGASRPCKRAFASVPRRFSSMSEVHTRSHEKDSPLSSRAASSSFLLRRLPLRRNTPSSSADRPSGGATHHGCTIAAQLPRTGAASRTYSRRGRGIMLRLRMFVPPSFRDSLTCH
jgi:hypothetical protein